VFVADHSGGFLEGAMDPSDHRVPFLMFGPKILPGPRRVGAVCSQTDVVPTVMSVLGGSYEHCFFGSSVLGRDAGDGFALVQRPAGGELSFIDHDGVGMTIPFGGEARMFRHEMPGRIVDVEAASGGMSARRAALVKKAVAMLQTASIVFERGAHNVPDVSPQPRVAATSKAAGVR
jgi:arylsulfatase A-like enzyme